MRSTVRRVAVLLLFAALALVIGAGRALAYTPPPLQGAVTDTSSTLAAAERAALEARLAAYRARTTNEVVVFLVPSLGNENVEDVAYGAFNTWKVGKKGKDNGVLLVLAVADRKMRIETGKGIGDKLTDIESGRILRERIGPFLKQKRWADGIAAGLDAIEAALDGRPAPPLPDPNAVAAAAGGEEPTRSLRKERVRIFDQTGRFSEEDVLAANRALQADWRSWSGVAVVLVGSSAAFSQAAAAKVRSTTGAWPVVVQISTSDRKANITDAPDFGAPRVAEARTRILKRLAEAPEVDLSVARDVGPIVAAIAVAATPAPAAPPTSPWLAILIPPLLFCVFVGVMVWVIARSKASGARGSTAGSRGASAGPYDATSSSTSSYDGGSSGGGGSDYGGGGGSSGGGGASDSW